jgi:hypothetical protein
MKRLFASRAYLWSDLVQLPVPLSSIQDGILRAIGYIAQSLLDGQDIPLNLVHSELRRESDVFSGRHHDLIREGAKAAEKEPGTKQLSKQYRIFHVKRHSPDILLGQIGGYNSMTFAKLRRKVQDVWIRLVGLVLYTVIALVV